MAWTTPRTWVPGELVTASMMNTHVRDNLNFLYSSTATVLGDTTVGTQHNWAPGLSGSTYINWAGASALTVTGFAGGVSGQMIFFRNVSSVVASFAHSSASSSVGNRFFNTVGSGNTPVATGGYAVWVHNGTFWVLIGHEQGAWITPTFAAGDYTAASGSWILTGGDVTVFRYRLSGTTLAIQMSLNTTEVSSVTATLNRVIPGGFTAATAVLQPVMRISDNGGAQALGMVTPSGTALLFYSSIGGGGWAISASTTSATGAFQFEVT